MSVAGRAQALHQGVGVGRCLRESDRCADSLRHGDIQLEAHEPREGLAEAHPVHHVLALIAPWWVVLQGLWQVESRVA